MKKIVNRIIELETLEKEYQREDASFVVIYGRRRVGKTSLINHFCEGKKSLYFLATEESEAINQSSFRALVGDFLKNDLLKTSVADWNIIFNELAKASTKERIIVVLDEFQYLGKANKAFPSVFMNIWDTILKTSNVMIILCGSLINMMASQVLNYSSPLYGRRTAQIKLKQIDFSYYHEFFDNLSIDDQILRYAVTGGMPKYIELFEDDSDIYEAIRKNVLSKNSYLYAEPEFLLQKEVSDIGTYFSILRAISFGNHKLSKIATVLETPQTSITKYLNVLADLDIIERQVPITEENPEKSKMGLYFIKDNFINFWFRFIYPNKSIVESDNESFALSKIKQSFIVNHASYVYEDICRKAAWKLIEHDITFDRLGRWWGSKDIKIDMVAYDSLGSNILFGECKFSDSPKGVDVLDGLKKKGKYVSWNQSDRTEYYVIFSKSGFTDELIALSKKSSNIILISHSKNKKNDKVLLLNDLLKG